MLNKKKEHEDGEIKLHPDVERSIGIFSQYSTEAQVQYLQKKEDTLAAGFDVGAHNPKYKNQSDVDILVEQTNQVVPYKSGEGATYVACGLELYYRSVHTQNLVVPITLDSFNGRSDSAQQAIYQSLGRLIEPIEQTHLLLDGVNSDEYSQLVDAYAKLCKAGGAQFHSMLRRLAGYKEKPGNLLGMSVLFPIGGRKLSGYVSATKDRKQFISDVLRKMNRVSKPRDLREMLALVGLVMHKTKTKQMHFVVDIPYTKGAKKMYDQFTNSKLLQLLKEHNAYIKIFAPEAVVKKNAEVTILDDYFSWNDEKILMLLDIMFRSAGTLYTIRGIQSKNSIIQHILKYSQQNPRRAVQITHALLQASASEDGWFLLSPRIWNKACANWSSNAVRPKPISA